MCSRNFAGTAFSEVGVRVLGVGFKPVKPTVRRMMMDGSMRALRRKEVALMRRIVLMVTVAVVMALMMALTGPAYAAIHPLAHMECANESADASPQEVPEEQDPPGLDGRSSADNEAQPVNSVSGNPTATEHAFKADVCPAG